MIDAVREQGTSISVGRAAVPRDDIYVKLYKTVRTSGLLAKISGNAFKVMADIALYINDEGEGWPGEDRICSDTGLGINTVKRCIRELLDQELVSVTQSKDGQGRWKSNVYTIHPDGGTFRFGSAPQHKNSATVEPEHKSCATENEASPEHKTRATVERATVDSATNKSQSPNQDPIPKQDPGRSAYAFSDTDLRRLWSDCRMLLEPTIGAASFVWLKDAELVAIRDGEAVISVRTENARQMASARLWRSVAEALDQAGIEAAPVFVVAKKEQSPSAAPASVDPTAAGPDLVAAWSGVLAELKKSGATMSDFKGSRIQAVERVDDECRRAVVMAPQKIDGNRYALLVATALTKTLGSRCVVAFLQT
jgi:hypothetical protein